MIQPKNKTEVLLLSIHKNSKTLTEQTHRKAEETLEFNPTKSSQTFSFNPPIHIEGSWMTEATSLEVYNSIFNITAEDNKFQLYTFPVSKKEELHMKKLKMRLTRLRYFRLYSHQFTR